MQSTVVNLDVNSIVAMLTYVEQNKHELFIKSRVGR